MSWFKSIVGFLFAAGLCSALAAPLSSPLDGFSAKIEHWDGVQVDTFEPGAKIFTDRAYTVAECPDFLNGVSFLRGSINATEFRVTQDGVITVLTSATKQFNSAQYRVLEANGFVHVADPDLFQLFGDLPENRVRMYQKQVSAGERYSFRKWTVVLGFSSAETRRPQSWADNSGELLYNGIRLPKTWPPEEIDPLSTAPMPVPYLDHPPKVIPIDVGRQLLVDDFLIEKTDLKRTFHTPEKYEGNPILKPETPQERGEVGEALSIRMSHLATHSQPLAAPKSGGCWWNPQKQIFELWYEAGWIGSVAYAVSTNGIDWVRPELDVVPGSNQVSPPGVHVDSWTVVRDEWTDDLQSRYKIFISSGPWPASCYVSPDGIHWSDEVKSGTLGDRSTMFYNPFRRKWVFSIRSVFRGRSRHYWEGDDFMKDNQWDDFPLKGRNWKKGQPVVWAAADELDPPDPDIGVTAQLYNLDAVAYESIMLGFFEIHRGPDNKICAQQGVPKITDLNFATSRDGFHWSRPDRTTAIGSERKAGAWDRGYVQSLGNICTVQGDRLCFYYSGFAGDPANTNPRSMVSGMYANGATGVAFLRRDGFASMDAAESGELLTRPVTFSGKCLFVNADVPGGSLRAEVLDANGKVIQPFTLQNSVVFKGDSTIQRMTWTGGGDLSSLAGQAVQFRFTLENGALYSFWVSRDETGRSDGYVAGGGPGYTGLIDTVGVAALDAGKMYSELAEPANPKRIGSVSSEPVAGGVVFRDVAYLPDGREEKLDVYLPETGGDARPCVLYIHGGGWSTGDKNAPGFFGIIAEKLLAEGIAVISVNYQLKMPRWPTNIHDCKRALRFVKAHAKELGIDPNYIISCGGSAGGHLSEMMALTSENPAYDEPDAPAEPNSVLRAGIGLFGVADLRRVMPSHKPRTWGSVVFKGTDYEVGDDVPIKDLPQMWSDASPIVQVQPGSIPMLLIHGDADTIVEWQQSEMLFEKGKSLGADFEFMKVPGAPHGLAACQFPGVMDRVISFVKAQAGK